MSTLYALYLAVACGVSTSPLGGIVAPPPECACNGGIMT